MPIRAPTQGGGITRRRLLQVGGSITFGAVFAACLGDGDSKESREDTGGAQGRRVDIAITRTISSLEEVAAVVYETVLDVGLFTASALADLAVLFQSHHREHAALFRGATEDLRGSPFTGPNPAVMQQLQPSIDALRDEATAVALALDVETILTATYQATVGSFGDKSFNIAAMSVGGAEARHAAAWARSLGQLPAPQALQGTGQAVPAGTGV